MKNKIIVVTLLLTANFLFAQKYNFVEIKDIETSSVKSQGNTGTCWSFSTSSFIESEVYRLTGEYVDISEMYSVRKTYEDKAWNYVMRQGKLQFSQGGLAHDVMNSIRDHGVVPESVFSGLFNQKKYDHSTIVPQVKKVLNAYIKNDKDSGYSNWKKEVSHILDEEIGEVPAKFTYKGNDYTPKSFAEKYKIDPNNYVTLTSFAHKPFYTPFVLNIPDNFSNGMMYNVTIDELTSIVEHALLKDYSIALDIDVSEKTFSAKNGIAVLPEDVSNAKKSLTEIVPEKKVTQKYRQQEFENYNTTDDHLMHMVGLLQDQKGNVYYKVKNSWGTNSDRIGNNGYIYMSVPYFKLKVISVLLHKDVVPNDLRKKMNF